MVESSGGLMGVEFFCLGGISEQNNDIYTSQNLFNQNKLIAQAKFMQNEKMYLFEKP